MKELERAVLSGTTRSEPMNIFICWSGRRGRAAARALKTWLKKWLPDLLNPKISDGIEKGAVWFDQLHQILDGSAAGLFCLTPEALASPWVHYEAGVLSKALGRGGCADVLSDRGRLFTFLWGVKASELLGPLAAFQSTVASDERDIRRLCEALLTMAFGAAYEERRDKLALEWPEMWNELRCRLGVIPSATLPEVWPEFESLFHQRTFEEPTVECVDQRWLARYEDVRNAARAMADRRVAVEGACRGYAVDLYRVLEREIDSYAIALSLLVTGPRFQIDDRGKVAVMPPGLIAACERRRRRARDLVARLTDSRQEAFFSEAVQFSEAEEFAERKNIIHRLTPAVAELAGRAALPEKWPADAFCFEIVRIALLGEYIPPASDDGHEVNVETEWRTSEWDLDRILYALYLEHRIRLSQDHRAFLRLLVDFTEAEMEKARAREAPFDAAPQEGAPRAPAMPIHYALRALDQLDPPKMPDSDLSALRWVLSGVLEFLDERKRADPPVRALVARIMKQHGIEPLPLAGKP